MYAHYPPIVIGIIMETIKMMHFHRCISVPMSTARYVSKVHKTVTLSFQVVQNLMSKGK